MSILVFSGQDDQLVLGQMLMIRHNVTFDYEKEVLSLIDNLIVKDAILPYDEYIFIFISLMVLCILIAFAALYWCLCHKGTKRVKQPEDAANSTIKGPEDARVSLAVSEQRR